MELPNRVSWVNVAVGILVVISPFVASPTTFGARLDMVVTGALIGIAAIVSLASHGRSQSMSYWPVVNILLGIWLFISTTFLAGNISMIWSNIVLGVLTIVTALVELSYQRAHVHLRT